MLFVIGAVRAIVEMLGLCLIGQGVLYLMAGQGRVGNPIYRAFALVGAMPLRLAGLLRPGASAAGRGLLAFLILFALWIGLALLRKTLSNPM